MTEEEKRLLASMPPEMQRKFVELINAPRPQMASGMSSPYMSKNMPQPTDSQFASANRDFTGREAALAAQMRGGREAIAAPGAQGIQAGNVYAAPTWSASLASGIRKGMGMYDIVKGRQGQEDLQTARDKSSADAGAIAKYGMDVEAEQQGITNFQNSRKIDIQDATLAESVENNSLTRAMKQREMEAAASKEQNANSSKWAGINFDTYVDPSGEGEPMPGMPLPGGEIVHPSTKEPIPKHYIPLNKQGEAAEIAANQGVNGEDLSALDALPAGERKYGRIVLSTITGLNKAITEANKVLQAGGSFTGGEDVVVGVAEGVAPKALENTARSLAKRYVYSKEEQNIKGLLTNASEAFKRARTGANLTQPETVLGDNWDPGTPGISDQEALQRAVNIIEFLNEDLKTLNLRQRDVARPWSEGDDKVQSLNDEAEALYQQFPNLRPK